MYGRGMPRIKSNNTRVNSKINVQSGMRSHPYVARHVRTLSQYYGSFTRRLSHNLPRGLSHNLPRGLSRVPDEVRNPHRPHSPHSP